MASWNTSSSGLGGTLVSPRAKMKKEKKEKSMDYIKYLSAGPDMSKKESLPAFLMYYNMTT